MAMEPATRTPRPGRPLEPFQVLVAIVAILSAAAALTFKSVRDAGTLVINSTDPTPYGYTVSLALFLCPVAGLGWWFLRHPEHRLPRKAFTRTILVLTPLGFVLDLLFGHTFFTFPNHGATLGIAIPAVGGPIPIEEFAFYLSGFLVVLLLYIWADEYWVAAYNVEDYAASARGMGRLARFHGVSVALGAALIGTAVLYKRFLSPSPEGFPSYFTYLVLASLVPSAGFFRTVHPFINWRAFGFTFFFILLVSLLWEATLGVPYGWWGYERTAMMGLTIRAWSGLPVEAVLVWFAVTFTTVIVYEVIKIWQALGVRAKEAFFGLGAHGAEPISSPSHPPAPGAASSGRA
jgi:hypothetical protein